MQNAYNLLLGVSRKAPYIKQHEQYKKSLHDQERWLSTHYPNQYTETDPSSAEWLRKQIPGKQSCIQYLKDSFPCIQWLPRYNLSWLAGDLVAGLTVGAVVIPQGMAYARLADLPVEMGLYSSFIGGVLYFMLGSSKDISIGPIAIASIVTNSVVDDIEIESPQVSRPEIAGLVALMAGAVISIISILRLGWLIDLIALPAIAAFVSGVAITITATQLSTLLGIRGVDESDAAYAIFINIFKKLGQTRVDAAIGIAALVLLYVIKWVTGRLSQRRPAQAKLWFFISTIRTVFVILLFILISFLVNHTKKANPAFRLVGTVPKGFHVGFQPEMTRKLFMEILPNLPTMVIVLLLEHMSIAKSFGRMNNYAVNPNSELLAIGVTNVISSFVGGYAVSGSFSRTAINAKAGSRTPLAGVIMGALVIIAIYLLVPMLYYIPNSVLAAVIIHAILDLITSPSTLYGFWRTNPFDLVIFVIGLTVMIFASVETGLYVTIALSMAIHLINILKTHGHLLGSVTRRNSTPEASKFDKNSGLPANEASNFFLPLDHADGCNPQIVLEMPPPGVFIYRMSDSFNFMNAARVLEQLVDQIKQQTRPIELTTLAKKGDQPWSVKPPRTEEAESAIKLRPTLKAIILDFSAVNHIDVTTTQALVDTRLSLDRYAAPNKLQWRFANIHNRWTKRALKSVGFGRPIFSPGTGEPEDFVALHTYVQQAEGPNPLRDIEASEKHDDPATTQLSMQTSIEDIAGVNDGMTDSRVEQILTPLYGINLPYFCPDIQSALDSVTLYLTATAGNEEESSPVSAGDSSKAS